MVTAVEEDTDAVVTVKLAVELPAATLTEAGTDAVIASVLDSEIVIPPVGAIPERVTVP
jgi:hypothetical protein